MLDDAACGRDLRSPPGNHFEKLGPPLDGRHSIRVTRKWRLIFEFDDTTGKAANVYLDPHSYRA
jgi:proteic killer suppression protein